MKLALSIVALASFLFVCGNGADLEKIFSQRPKQDKSNLFAKVQASLKEANQHSLKKASADPAVWGSGGTLYTFTSFVSWSSDDCSGEVECNRFAA